MEKPGSAAPFRAFAVAPLLAGAKSAGIQFGDIAPTKGMEAILLAQRLAYNAVTSGEWLGGVLRGLSATGGLLWLASRSHRPC